MAVLHLVTSSIYPAAGGVQESVLRIGRGLAAQGFEVVIYTFRQPPDCRRTGAEHDGVAVVHLGEESEIILEPVRAVGESSPTFEAEQTRVELLYLRNAISQRVRDDSGGRHAIVSFYASGTGFIAQQVATRLELPHVASFRGTDYSRDAFGERTHAKVRFVAERATQIVTTNREQAEGLAAMFDAQRPIRTIHNSILNVDQRPHWEPPPPEAIQLFSDCGFSAKKGTQLLLRAVGALIEKNLPVSLTILGGVFASDSESYWEECRRDFQARYPGRFHFPGQQPRDGLDDRLRAAHIYCSATLGEGCSLSRIRALTIGIPIVTTCCGALPEVASDCAHVRLCPPGDWALLARELEAATAEIRTGALHPDRERIQDWRRHFSPDREIAEWRAVVEDVLG